MSQTESDRSGKETDSARAREAERKRPKTSRRAAHFRSAYPYAPQRRADTVRNVGLFSGPRRSSSRRACSLPQESPGVLLFRAPDRLPASRTEGAQGLRFLFPLFQPPCGLCSQEMRLLWQTLHPKIAPFADWGESVGSARAAKRLRQRLFHITAKRKRAFDVSEVPSLLRNESPSPQKCPSHISPKPRPRAALCTRTRRARAASTLPQSCPHLAAKPPRPRRHPRRAPPMRRQCGARAPQLPHPCAADAARIVRHDPGHPPTLRPSRGARTSLGLRLASRAERQGSTPAAASGVCGLQHTWCYLIITGGPSGYIKPSEIQIEAKSKPNRAYIEAKSSPNRAHIEAKSTPNREQIKGKSKASQKQADNSHGIVTI